MTLDLATARAVVLDHLDDTNDGSGNGDRWTSTQVDRALSQALSQCIDEYIASGGDRLDELLDTTSNTSGEIDLSTIDPLTIKGVSLLEGTRYWPIKALKVEEKNIIDNTTRSLQIRYVRKFSLPTTTTHKLVGNGATAGNSWDNLDNWICAKAALYCSIKDAEARPEIKAMAEDMRFSVMSHSKIPKAVPFPTRRPYISQWYGYVYHQNAKKMILVRPW
jgi:hypothetical protein